jgi:transposase
MSRRYEISDINWIRIAPLMKGKPGDVGRSSADKRLFINAVIWIVRSGAAWRDLPAHYGAWNSVYHNALRR